MSPPFESAARLDREAFGLAVGAGLVAGSLSLLAPYLLSLVSTLAALAVASWAIGRSRASGGRRAFVARGRILPIGILVSGAFAFLLLPDPAAAFRGILLALSLVPLWWWERVAPDAPLMAEVA